MKIQIIILSILLLSFTCMKVQAQERKHKELTHEKKHKLADNLINQGSYYSAIDHLEEIAKKHPKNINYQMRLADAFFLSRDYKNAEEWYGRVVKVQKKVSVAMYKYAACMKYNGKYVEARDLFRTFAQSKYRPANKKDKYKLLARNEVLSCEWVLNNQNVNEQVTTNHLGDHVNSRYSEFAPVLLNDSTLIFSSLQSDTVITVGVEEAHLHHVKILASDKQGEEWGEHRELTNINTPYESNANGTFSIDGKTFYFTRCIQNADKEMRCDIYKSEIIDGQMQKPEKLDEPVNKKGFTSTQPHIAHLTATNRQVYEVLFFASDRPGGRGGMDIWYSILTPKGGYRTPANAGNVINTPGDEVTPFFHKNTHTLYFSSNYHYGYGGYDIFKSAGTISRWEKPVNIGKPVNSRVDDVYYTIPKDYGQGFFVSNRPEGYHLTSETCCDDIYSYKIKRPQILQTYAYSKSDTTQQIEATFLVSSKSSQKMLSDSIPLMSEDYKAYFKDNIISDSLLRVKYKETASSRHNFELDPYRDYMVYAIRNKDTSAYLFYVTDDVYEAKTIYASDSMTNSLPVIANEVDILKVRFYMGTDTLKPVVPVADEVAKQLVFNKETIEDGRTHTVTKFIEEVKEKGRGKIILNYDFDDARFIEIHAPSLDSLADVLKEYPDLKINIASHTDDKGSEQYNMELSKKRARSIELYLSKKGIEKTRMISSWYGESLPLVPNSNPDGSDNPENRHFNRRSEITIIEE